MGLFLKILWNWSVLVSNMDQNWGWVLFRFLHENSFVMSCRCFLIVLLWLICKILGSAVHEIGVSLLINVWIRNEERLLRIAEWGAPHLTLNLSGRKRLWGQVWILRRNYLLDLGSPVSTTVSWFCIPSNVTCEKCFFEFQVNAIFRDAIVNIYLSWLKERLILWVMLLVKRASSLKAFTPCGYNFRALWILYLLRRSLPQIWVFSRVSWRDTPYISCS